MTSSPERAVEILRFSLMVRWRPVLFPLDQFSLMTLLPERGYVIPENILNQRHPFGGRLEVGGTIGRKGRMALVCDIDRPGIGIDGIDPSETIEEFDGVEQLLSEEFRVSEKEARYYEVDAQAVAPSSGMSIDYIRAQESPLSEQVGRLLGHSLSTYALRLCSSHNQPVDEEWYDVSIEPTSRSLGTAYNTFLTFRSHDRLPVVDVARRVNDIFRGLVELVEKS